MIKVCSLDFVNKETFETDVLTAEGVLLCSATDKVTPEKVLKLYFKEIFVKESKTEYKTEPIADSIEMITENISKLSSATNDSEDEETKILGVKASISEETAEIGINKHGPRLANSDDSDESEATESKIKGPRAAVIDEIETEIKGPKNAESKDTDDLTKGPRLVDLNGMDEDEETETKGPRIADSNKYEDDEIVAKSPMKKTYAESEPAVAEIPEEEQPLTFDDEQAKRIVEHSVKLGKLLSYPANDLKELEQVAYYYNAGIIKCKKADKSRKDFRKQKAFASYQLLLESNQVPSNIAEIVKLTANAYESDAFPLNSKIPYHHIVAITGYYEDLLSQNESKELTLMKMLQMGGNHFNIFVLHKFIKLMRDN